MASSEWTIQELCKEYRSKADSKPAAIALFDRALNRLEYSKYTESAELFTQLSKMDPKCAGAYFGLSQCYMFKEQYNKAIDNVNKAIVLRAKEPRFFHLRGLQNIALLNYPKAISDFTTALKLDPKRISSLKYRAASYGAVKKHDEAIRDYDTALKLDPNDEGAMYSRANVYQQKRDWSGAVKAYDYILNLSAIEEQALIERGLCKIKVEDYKGAIKDFTTALQLGSENPSLIYKNRAIAYERLGLTKMAQRDRDRSEKSNASRPK